MTSGIYATLPLDKKQEFLDSFLKILAAETISLEKWPEFQERVHQLLLKSYDLHFSSEAISEVLKSFREKNAKSETLIEEIHKHFLEVEKYKLNLLLLTNSDLKKRIEECRTQLQHTNSMNDAQKCYLIALCLETSRRTIGVKPTLIQIFNLLAYLQDPKARRISSQQKSTERSMVLAWLAAFKAMNMSVDMICLNAEQAYRNVHKFKDFFNFLGLNALAYSASGNSRVILEADILYGTLENFESNYLEHLDTDEALLFKPVRQRKAFEVVIIDEMSDLFLDSKHRKLQIKKPVSYLNPKLYQIIYEYMFNKNGTSKSKEELQRILYQALKVVYPFHRLERWMKSYEIAATYSINKDYLVGDQKITVLQETEEDPIEKPGKRFPKGIHCFLEIRHNINPIPELGIHTRVFHADFINLYRQCFGASTSMVTVLDRDELLKVYQLSHFRSPLYFQNQKVFEPVLIAENGEEQNKLLIKELNEKLEKGRPVVIYCENPYDCRTIYADLDEEFGYDDETIVQTFHEFTRTEDEQLGDQSEDLETFLRAGLPRSITIATEAALDLNKIPLDKRSLTAGGLHVIVIYPPNKRRFLESFFVAQYKPGSLRYLFEKIDLESQIEDFSYTDASGKICKLRAETIAKDKLFKQWGHVLERKIFFGNLMLYHNVLLNSIHAELQKLRYHLWKLFSKEERNKIEYDWSTFYSYSVNQFKELSLKLARTPLTSEFPIVIQHEAEKCLANTLAEIWKRYPIINTVLKTPLHYALEYQNESLAILLAEQRPDYIDVPNAKGEISIDLALKYNFTSFIKTFEKGVSIREGIKTLEADLKTNASPKAYRPLVTIYEYIYGPRPKAPSKTAVKVPPQVKQ